MDCRNLRNTSQILVGLERIGLVGLEEAFAVAEEAENADRETTIDRMVEVLAQQNYMPATALQQYRNALWREHLRRQGEDIREFYSVIEVVVRSTSSAETEAFTRALESAFAKHELKPRVTTEAPDPDARTPQLLIDDELVIEGTTDPRRVATAVGRQISDW